MKRILLYIGIAIAAIGCTKDADVELSGDGALTITSSIATRAEKSAWGTGDAIGVYVTGSTDESVVKNVSNIKFTTSDGLGNFTSTTPVYLPLSSTVDLFAYYPYSDAVGFDPAACVVTTSEQVDLLTATKKDVGGSTSTVNMTFSHSLSKISLTFKAGDGLVADDLKDLVVTLSEVSTSGTFNLLKNEVVANSLAAAGDLSFPTPATITVDQASVLASSMIVIPQTLNGSTLYVKTKNYGTFSTQLSTTTTTLTTGNEYSYKVTVDRDRVDITSANIDNWDPNTGSGTEADIVDIEKKGDIYYINSAKGLAAFSDLVNNKTNTTATSHNVTYGTGYQLEIDAVLTRDIDLTGTSWSQIGCWVTGGDKYYNGTFDGGGYEISGINISTSGNQQSLFRGLDPDGVIYNLGVSGSATHNSNASNASEMGGLVTWNKGTIINCYSEVDITAGGVTYVGGIAAYNVGYVVNCYNHGNITGETNVGGIVGWNDDGGYVGYCYSTGTIEGTSNATDEKDKAKVGGVVGWNHKEADGISDPTIKGSFCLGVYETDYSIGQTDYSESLGLYGNVCDNDYLKSQSFATTLTNGADTYNDADKHGIEIDACAWLYNAGGYPTLDFNNTAAEIVVDISYNSLGYNIYSAKGLQAFAALVNGDNRPDGLITSGDDDSYFVFGTAKPSIDGKLIKDIDLKDICGDGTNSEDADWIPIGDYDTNTDLKYSGTFNGNGHVITGLYINIALNYQGLFGKIVDATISNLGVEGSVEGNGYIGGIAGYASSSSITGCYNSASVTAKSNGTYVGGIVGFASGSPSTITSCYNSGAITASGTGTTIGGVVGYASSTTIKSCYSYGSVDSQSSSDLGGVVGSSSGGSIDYCYYDTSKVEAETKNNAPSTAVGSSSNGTTDETGKAEGFDASYSMSTLLTNLQAGDSEAWKADSETDSKRINSGYPILSWQVVND